MGERTLKQGASGVARHAAKPAEFLSRPGVMWTALGVLTAINVYTWLRYFQPAPFTDMVDLEWFFTNWSLARDGVAPLVTYPDNEHRAFLPVLLQAFDHKALGSTGLFLILVHIMCFAVLAAGFARHAALGFIASPRLAHLSAGAMALVMLWSAHWNNIIRTKQTHTCLALLFVTIAFWLAARFDARRVAACRVPDGRALGKSDWAMLAGIGAALWAAVWSFTAGLAAAPVLLAFAFVRNWGWAARGFLIVVSGAAMAAWGWASATGATGGEAGQAGAGLFTYLHYGANLLGGLFHDALAGDKLVAPVIGGVFFFLALPLAWFGLRQPFRERAGLGAEGGRAASFFTLMLGWALACALAITTSRAGFGADQAFVSRYLPFGVVFAASTVMLAVLFRSLLPKWTSRAVLGVTMFYLVAIVLVSPRGWVMAADHNRHIALGGLAAALEIDDAQYTLYPNFAGGRLLEIMVHYRARDGSLFRRDWGGWLGAPIGAATGGGACARVSGEAALEPLDGGAYRVAARVDGAAPLWIAVVDGQGRVAGLARAGARFRTAPAPAMDDPGYAGFARLGDPQSVRYVAMLGGGRRCAL